jgi:hypothetical protein
VQVTIMFASLASFNDISAALSPHALVILLNQIFSAFDRRMETSRFQDQVYKVEHVANFYIAVG